MSKIMDIIAEETNGKSYSTFKYGFEGVGVPTFSYDDDRENFSWQQSGETTPPDKYKDLSSEAKKISTLKPLFTYFLDGSRLTYKVDDISYNNRVYPVIAGQIGISCCKRVNKIMQKYDFERSLVITLPKIASKDDWGKDQFFAVLKNKINERDTRLEKCNIKITKIIPYTPPAPSELAKTESKGIAKIQDEMIDREIAMVTKMVSEHKINQDNYLLKDGSLEYRVDGKTSREKRQFQSFFKNVVGVSKSFNPANCKDKRGKNNSNMIAELPLFHRTPVAMYTSERLEGMTYAVWYIRIRDAKYTTNTFDGILKIEKILVTDEQIANGLDTEEVDLISANIINERNPVCYGADFRWANHLYPVYVTESFAKSKYLSDSLFLSLF